MVVLGLITSERVVLGKGATGNSSTSSWKMKLMGRRKDRMTGEKMVSKERKME